MNFWDFMDKNGFGVFVAFWIVIYYAYWAHRDRGRARNIRLHGWPPPPLDADGDVIYPEVEKEDEAA